MDTVKLEMKKALSGSPILYVNNKPIQNKEDPEASCYKYIKDNKTDQPVSSAIVFGHDFGYTADAVLKMHPEIKNLFIYEPINEIFSMCVPARDDLFQNPKVYISNNLSNFITQLEALYSPEEGFALYTAPYWPQYFEGPFKEFIETVQRRLAILRNQSINFKDLRKEEAINILRNLPIHTRNPDIQELQHAGFKKPVVVCSSGPSLKNNIEELKNKENKIIIISTASSFKYLKDNGINPQFVISSSENRDVINFFKDTDKTKTALVAPLTSYYELQKLLFLKVFTFISLRSIYKQWVFENIKEAFSFDGGVSEECTAFSLGIILGGSPLALLGFESLEKDNNSKAWLEASYVTLKKELKYTAPLWNISTIELEGYETKTLKDVIELSTTVNKHDIIPRIKVAKNLPWQSTLLADAILEIAQKLDDPSVASLKYLRNIPMYNSFKVEEFGQLLKDVAQELNVYLEEK